MKLPIPDKFRLGPFDVRVKWYSPEELKDLGSFVPYKSLIQMDNDISEDREQELFLHEIMEAINHHYEVGLEHKQITVIAVAIAQVIRDLEE